MKNKPCAYCGTIFTPRTTMNKYCSPVCKHKVDLERRSKKPIYKTCKLCGSKFKPYTSLDKFCSADCRIENSKLDRAQNRRWSEDSIRRRMGKNNPAYRNGNYVRGAKKTAVGDRKFRANVKSIKDSMIDGVGYIYCQFCGTSNSARFEGHHIIYRSEKPLHKNLHTKKNVLLLCISCHNEFHKYKRMRDDIVIERGLDKIFGREVLLNANLY